MNLIRKYKISKLTGNLPEGKDGEIISFMKSILEDLTIFKHKDFPNSIFYMNSEGKWVFEQNYEFDVFCVNYIFVWKVLEKKYSMKYTDIQEFIKYMVEEAFKQKVSTPLNIATLPLIQLEEAFKQKVSTPTGYNSPKPYAVEEAFEKLNK